MNHRYTLAALLTAVMVSPHSVSAIDYTQYDAVVDPILEQMTLAEKIGQMTQAELDALKGLGEIADLALGSILSGGNSDPEAGNSVAAWADTYDACQRAALESRLGIPLLYGIDAVHGHSNVEGAVIFPHNIGLGCANNAELVEEIGRLTALEVRATGINWTFAPCVTVPRDDRWGRTYEGFSEDPARVAVLGAAAVRGIQTDDLADPAAVLGCAKHFVGDGGTIGEVRESSFHEKPGMFWDQGDTRCDEDTLRRIHVAPYLPCLEAGVGSIMPSYSSWNGVKCTGSKELLTDLLKDELGFDGFLISDYNAIDQCHPDFKTAVGIAVNAGVDMAMAPTSFRKYIRVLTELVDEGVVPMSRIDDAARRVLRVKAAMGLLDEDPAVLTDPRFATGVGSEERRAVARQAVAESIVILKNDGVLPLNPNVGSYHVVGAAADDLGMQCGGWTIDWQGKMGEVTTGGTTILDAIQERVGANRLTSCQKNAAEEPVDATVVVVGEKPYAEGLGDNAELTLSDEDLAVIERAIASDSPTVVVLLSGRPLVLPPAVLDGADAIVAAWLPGTEGDGVVDVLTGAESPKGTLSFSWPRSADQHPLNIGDEGYDPLFPVGYGLSYPVGATAEQPTSSYAR
ncbi:MAG: glycoside hydrolase family 3 N-terminal domain-containing protein [Planctomycetota bacterium]